MPSCFMVGCTRKSKKQNDVIKLHVFPKDTKLIGMWLWNCGIPESEIENQVMEVVADKRAYRFRVCSMHFSDVQYKFCIKLSATGAIERLKVTAVPDINLSVTESYVQVALFAPQETIDTAQPTLDAGPSSAGLLHSTTTTSTETQTCWTFTSVTSVHCQTDVYHEDFGQQTNLNEFPSCDCKDKYVQWPEYEENYFGEVSKVQKDHGYYCKAKPVLPPVLHSPPAKGGLQTLMTPIKSDPIYGAILQDSLDETLMGETVDGSQDDQVKNPYYGPCKLPADDRFSGKVCDDMEQLDSFKSAKTEEGGTPAAQNPQTSLNPVKMEAEDLPASQNPQTFNSVTMEEEDMPATIFHSDINVKMEEDDMPAPQVLLLSSNLVKMEEGDMPEAYIQDNFSNPVKMEQSDTPSAQSQLTFSPLKVEEDDSPSAQIHHNAFNPVKMEEDDTPGSQKPHSSSNPVKMEEDDTSDSQLPHSANPAKMEGDDLSDSQLHHSSSNPVKMEEGGMTTDQTTFNAVQMEAGGMPSAQIHDSSNTVELDQSDALSAQDHQSSYKSPKFEDDMPSVQIPQTSINPVKTEENYLPPAQFAQTTSNSVKMEEDDTPNSQIPHSFNPVKMGEGGMLVAQIPQTCNQVKMETGCLTAAQIPHDSFNPVTMEESGLPATQIHVDSSNTVKMEQSDTSFAQGPQSSMESLNLENDMPSAQIPHNCIMTHKESDWLSFHDQQDLVNDSQSKDSAELVEFDHNEEEKQLTTGLQGSVAGGTTEYRDADKATVASKKNMQISPFGWDSLRTIVLPTADEQGQSSELVEKAAHSLESQMQAACTEHEERCKDPSCSLRHQNYPMRPHECAYCEKSFLQHSELLVHLSIHIKPVGFSCSICKRFFTSSVSLQIHQKSHTRDLGNGQPCKHRVIPAAQKHSECSDSGEELDMRRGCNLGSGPYLCPKCGKAFKRRFFLYNHIKSHSEKLFHCTECTKSFRYARLLNHHQKAHASQNLHKCPECKKGFSDAYTRITHQLMHIGGQPYECTDCKKTFCHSSALKQHQTLHSGKKPHQCTDCKKYFSSNSALIVHRRVHTGEKPYKCTKCTKAFSHKAGLKKHQKSHAGENT